MRAVLDPGRQVGNLRIAAISLGSIKATELKAGAMLQASKRPLALLILADDDVAAYAATGQRLDPAEIEELCPGAIAAFLAKAP